VTILVSSGLADGYDDEKYESYDDSRRAGGDISFCYWMQHLNLRNGGKTLMGNGGS
jgi:hypothetical protein